MIVISDTSAISNLFIVKRLNLLHQLYGEIIIPEAVMNELLELEKRHINLSEIKTAAWIKIASVKDNSHVQELLNEIDLGEAEAIVLAKQLNADWLLIDETKGRDIARSEGIQIIGLLGVLLLSKQKGLIPTVKEPLDEIIHTAKFRVSADLYDALLKFAGESR
jgi:predicted nucleic acid-binding protein